MRNGPKFVLFGFALLLLGLIMLRAKWIGLGILGGGIWMVSRGLALHREDKKRLEAEAELRRTGRLLDAETFNRS